MSLRKIVCYHYRRAGRDPDLREFIVVLEKDGRLVKVGEVLNCEGTFHKPRQIFELIEKHGYKPVLVYSCFRWYWDANRYISAEDERYYWRSDIEQDKYGRSYIKVLYLGYFEKVDVFKNGKSERFWSKFYFDHEGKETVKFNNIPKEVEETIDKAEWLEAKP
jgi:hypothetical protein